MHLCRAAAAVSRSVPRQVMTHARPSRPGHTLLQRKYPTTRGVVETEGKIAAPNNFPRWSRQLCGRAFLGFQAKPVSAEGALNPTQADVKYLAVTD